MVHKQEKVTHPFPPLCDSESRVLILGSFPSAVSREQGFYYANRTNRFWPVLSEVFEEEITDRAEFCHMHHLALWDVIASCTISGSSDASIHDAVPNPIADLVKDLPVKKIFTTGKLAYRLYERYIDCGIEVIGLPSTSSANARMSLEDLVSEYRKIRIYAEQKN
ncbi:MAG: DNA-deoxyinosine glycosylase [Solobacterium sp.]|jgi:TDG/mug DNA glycosylase family protein|nr:DNA-deoxyinosine glycosylase [Solobacterium sp.]